MIKIILYIDSWIKIIYYSEKLSIATLYHRPNPPLHAGLFSIDFVELSHCDGVLACIK